MVSPTSEKSDEFQLVVSGEVESGLFSEVLNSATISFDIVSQADAGWISCSGETCGLSLKCTSPSTEFIWNLPIFCAFSTPTPIGWPRMVLSIFTTDWRGRDILYGYGLVLVPSQPGRHTRRVQLYAPESTSWWGELSGWVLGKRPMLINPAEFLCGTTADEKRTVIMYPRTDTYITVNFHIFFQNL